MATELSLSDIETKLNEIFDSGERLIFWYDVEGSFEDTVEQMELHEAQVYRLEPENSFRTKIKIEHDDPTGKYLLYAPFGKPDAEHNHLEDTLLYSKEFYADRMSLIASEINVPDGMRNRLRSIAPFFGVGTKITSKKQRRETEKRAAEFVERAKEINLQSETEDVIPVIAMCVISEARNTTFDDLVYAVLSNNNLENDEILEKFDRLGLIDDFWRMCLIRYGFGEEEPNLIKLVRNLFATYISKDLPADIPAEWGNYILSEKTNVNVLLDNMMNSILYRDIYDSLSEYAANLLDLNHVLESAPIEGLLYSSAGTDVDKRILSWLVDRLLDENRLAVIEGKDIKDICQIRQKLHYGKQYQWEYKAASAAFDLMAALDYSPGTSLQEIAEAYCKQDYKIDQAYRHFIYAYDKIEDSSIFDALKDRVLNIYQTEYLEKIVYAWNTAYADDTKSRIYQWQKDFYRFSVEPIREKVAVIVSDALRYEVAAELSAVLDDDQNCDIKFSPMLGTLPSYTQVGMAELLPHDDISMIEGYEVLADGCSTAGTVAREKILQTENEKSIAIQYDKLKSMKVNEIRDYTAGKEVIYIYHNTIDARGETLTTENNVFDACQEAIDNIYGLIKTLSKSGNIYRFIVTADHGFIYNRKQITESDKLSNNASADAFKDRRFIIDNQDLSTDGVYAIRLEDALGGEDDRYIMLAKGMSVFKTGGGMNYVHGGSSPQELLIPNLFVKTQKGVVDTEDVKLLLISNLTKVTNLIMPLDFLQEFPVSDTIKAAKYKIFFAADDGEKISNEVIYMADNKSEDPKDRMFRLRFDIKRKTYSNDRKYYLKIINDKTGKPILEKQVIMDLPFTDNFGF